MLKLMLPMFALMFMSWSNTSMILILFSFMLMPKFISHLSLYSTSLFSFMDQLSVPLIILTLWTSALMLMASSKILMSKFLHKEFNLLIITLLITLMMSFLINNLMLYYIFFEASLIPTLLLILGWGYQPERLQASMYLMLYTITASLPLLISLQMILFYNSSLFMKFSYFNSLSFLSIFMSIFLALAFLVKMPMYLSHLWLPKAHVEAPVAGSMILAGILLKLGAYGIFRLMFTSPIIMKIISPFSISISMWGAFMTAMICIRQQDMKSLIAYSSVGHMALLISGLYSMSKWGWEGSLSMMLAHGLSSSALFSLANMNYESSNSRSMMLNKGMLFLAPSMALWWFMSAAANMAAPPTLNLMAEILLMTSILWSSLFTSPLLAMSSFLAAAYSLILFTTIHHGPLSQYSNSLMNTHPKNHIISFMHLLPLFIFISSAFIFSSL